MVLVRHIDRSSSHWSVYNFDWKHRKVSENIFQKNLLVGRFCCCVDSYLFTNMKIIQQQNLSSVLQGPIHWGARGAMAPPARARCPKFGIKRPQIWIQCPPLNTLHTLMCSRWSTFCGELPLLGHSTNSKVLKVGHILQWILHWGTLPSLRCCRWFEFDNVWIVIKMAFLSLFRTKRPPLSSTMTALFQKLTLATIYVSKRWLTFIKVEIGNREVRMLDSINVGPAD